MANRLSKKESAELYGIVFPESFSTNEIYAICDQAKQIADMSHLNSSHSSEVENAYAKLLDRIVGIGERVSQKSSSNTHELKCKIKLWQILAPQDLFNPEKSTVDEKLLLSIVNDFLKLN